MKLTTNPIGSQFSLNRLTFFTLENLLAGEFSISDLRQAIGRVTTSSFIQFAIEIGPPVAVHLAGGISPQSFNVHHSAVVQYISKAEKFCNECDPGPGWLDRVAAPLALAVGAPPRTAYPIYFISSETGGAKEVVYVGRTAAKKGRFADGHHAISKLHAPQYQGTTKQVYMASVLARISESEWINLELINPGTLAEFFLSEVELNLIFGLQPALNEEGKTTLLARAEHQVLVHDPYSLVKGTSRITVASVGR